MEEIVLIIIGVISGFLGATVGSGGLISIPGLLFFGLSPHIALATNTFADSAIFISAIKQYKKSKNINWKIAKQLTILTLVGSALGVYLFTKISAKFLEHYITIIILISLVFIFVNKDSGIRKKTISQTSLIIGLILFFIVVVNGTIVSAGGATIKLLILIYFLGFNFLEGYATSIPAQVAASTVSTLAFLYLGYVDILYGIFLALGGILGAYIGSKIAIEKGSKWLKGLFTVVVLILLIKLLFF